jgi:lipopolysaccharide export system ATP-binding protein
MNGGVVLRGQGIVVRYGAQRVLAGVDVAVRGGRILALLGPTGVGKSTLFRVLVGEATPAEGQVLLHGACVTRLALWERARRGVGYLPQGPSVLPDLSVARNLQTFERLAGRSSRGVAHWAGAVGLRHRLALRASELSGGERRLLELARALIAEPCVLLCDEPFAGIDPAGAWRVARMLRECAARGVAVCLSDHHATIALRVADEAALLLDGKFVVQAKASEFARDRVVQEVYLGVPLPGVGAEAGLGSEGGGNSAG